MIFQGYEGLNHYWMESFAFPIHICGHTIFKMTEYFGQIEDKKFCIILNIMAILTRLKRHFVKKNWRKKLKSAFNVQNFTIRYPFSINK